MEPFPHIHPLTPPDFVSPLFLEVSVWYCVGNVRMKGLHFENRKRAASWRACTPGATPSPCATSEHVSNVTTSDGSFKHYFGQGLLRAPVARLTRPPFGLLLVIFLQLLQQAASVMFDIPPHGRDCFFVKSVNANTELVG